MFTRGNVGLESACLIPGLGRSLGEGIRLLTPVFLGFPAASDGKESACNAGDLGSIPGLGRSPGEGTWLGKDSLWLKGLFPYDSLDSAGSFVLLRLPIRFLTCLPYSCPLGQDCCQAE